MLRKKKEFIMRCGQEDGGILFRYVPLLFAQMPRIAYVSSICRNTCLRGAVLPLSLYSFLGASFISKMSKFLTVLSSLNSLEWSDMVLTIWMGLESE